MSKFGSIMSAQIFLCKYPSLSLAINLTLIF